MPAAAVPAAADVTPSAPQAAPQAEAAAAPPPPSVRSDGKNEVLVATLKKIVGLAKRGNGDEAYREYFTLFSSELFAGCRPEDQRQALKLMVMSKAPPASAEAVTQAHRAAIARLKVLVEKFGEPGDHELLGISQIAVDERSEASDTFKKGLAIERERGSQSELCGTLMRRISEL
jgi:hypothetical protein